MKEKLVTAIADMNEDEALRLAEAMLDAGEDPRAVLAAAQEAMGIVGARYEAKEYFLPELIIAGDMLGAIGDRVKPLLKGDVTGAPQTGTVVIGTVAGDIHNIGKDIVSFMLEVNNFKVHDVGVDAAPAKFVQAIRDYRPDIVGMSGFLTLGYDQMRATVAAIKEASLRDRVKIMVGGAIMDDGAAAYAGADAYGADAAAAVKLAQSWVGGR